MDEAWRMDSATHLEATGTAEVAARIWAGSAGNPFVIVETVRAIEQRAWAPNDALPLPDQVRSLIGARLDRLSVRGRQLTALSAVIGREFSFELLERSSGLGTGETDEVVEALIRRRVLRAVGEQFEAGPRPPARGGIRATLAHPAEAAARQERHGPRWTRLDDFTVWPRVKNVVPHHNIFNFSRMQEVWRDK